MFSRWKLVLWIGGTLFAALGAAVTIASVEVSRHARDWVDDWLTERYQSDVDLSTFRISVYPHISAVGENLALHFEDRKNLPPLIAVKRFSLQASLFGLLRNPRHIQIVRLEGLELNIPPREERTDSRKGVKAAAHGFRPANFDEIVSDGAILKILTAKPGKDPLEFDIEHVVLHPTETPGQLAFQAILTNAKPPGDIFSTGRFGPWQADAPSLTPVSGVYTFDNADLGVFQGISGTLSSKGEFQGVLERIKTSGTTDTPDFRITRSGHPLDLRTTFHAIVDGTDGDTYLDPVECHFLNTVLMVRGKAEGVKGKSGKTITLDVAGNHARIENLLLLAIKGPPPMSGPVQLKTKFLLPSGSQEIPDRLNLDGMFNLASVHFTSNTVQQKFDNLSKRSLGKAGSTSRTDIPDTTDDVASAMKGDFQLKAGILTLPSVQFEVPGANVKLHGTYDLDQELLDLHGHLEMQAKLSQMTTGIKSFFLKAVDPFFSKNGNGTVLPIKITGSVKQPSYGLDFHHKEEANNPVN